MSSVVDPDIADPRTDRLLGPIRRLVESPRQPGEPSGLSVATAHLSDLGNFLDWTPDPQGSGCTFNRRQSIESALGEAVERYCGNVIPTPDALASYDDLIADPDALHPVDPLRLGLLSDEQYEVLHDHVPPSRSQRLSWYRCEDLTAQRSALVPGAAIYLHAARHDGHVSIPTRLAGIAAGSSVADASRRALLELIERDATSRWWHLGEGATPLDTSWLTPDQLPTDPSLAIDCLRLPSIDEVSVVAAVMRDVDLGIVCVGFAARTDGHAAVLKAIGECYQLRRINQSLVQPDSWIWKQVAERSPRALPVIPYRGDRAYASDLRAERDFTQLIHNTQFYLDPVAQPLFWARLQQVVRADVRLPTDGETGATLEHLVDSLRPRTPDGIYARDITTEDMRALGYVVSRVIAPDLITNMPDAYTPRADLTRYAGRPFTDPVLPLPHA